MRREVKFKMPLARSIAAGDALKHVSSNVVSPLTFQNKQHEAARRVATVSGDPLASVRFRADTFAAHLEGFLRTDHSQLIEAARDRSRPRVAAVCQQALAAAGKDPEMSHHVLALATSLREAFETGHREIENVFQQWGTEAMDTPAARHAVQGILMRLHSIGNSAVHALSDVHDARGNNLVSEMRTMWESIKGDAHSAIERFNEFEDSLNVKKPSSAPRM